MQFDSKSTLFYLIMQLFSEKLIIYLSIPTNSTSKIKVE